MSLCQGTWFIKQVPCFLKDILERLFIYRFKKSFFKLYIAYLIANISA